jgi:hypothetical protein
VVRVGLGKIGWGSPLRGVGYDWGNIEWCCEEEIPRTSMDCCT